MPCSVAFHVPGRVAEEDARLSWLPGNIVIAWEVGHKWSKKEKRYYQIAKIDFWTKEEASKFQGIGGAVADLDAMHRTDGERAAMRNPKIISPVPKDLVVAHIQKGPYWDNQQAVADIMKELVDAVGR